MNRKVAKSSSQTRRSKNARLKVNGAARPAGDVSPTEVCGLLNRGLATEIVNILRNRRHYYLAEKIHSSFADEFLLHSKEVLSYAEQFAERIVQLGGEPELSPDGLAERSHVKYVAGRTLTGMISEDLDAERLTIKSYRMLLQSLGGDDPTTRRIVENILAVEKDYADELATLLETLLEVP